MEQVSLQAATDLSDAQEVSNSVQVVGFVRASQRRE